MRVKICVEIAGEMCDETDDEYPPMVFYDYLLAEQYTSQVQEELEGAGGWFRIIGENQFDDGTTSTSVLAEGGQ
jgi:hypothetical protein